MSKTMPLFVALLAACGGTAVTNDALSGEASAQRGGMAADPWVGEYGGPAAGGMDGSVAITAAGANRYQVEIAVGGEGCGGGVSGHAVAANNRLSLVVPVPDRDEQCRVSLVRRGPALTVTEEGGCLYFHGARCQFDATVTRRGRSAATRPRASSGSSSIVGTWAASRVDCMSNGVILRDDGVYNADGEGGTWTLAGTALTLVKTHDVPIDGDAIPVRQPRRTSIRVAPLAGGRMSWRVGNHPAQIMVRCPPG